MLEVTSLTKLFPISHGLLRKKRGHLKALCDLSFSMRAGETLGVVGESGSGKSTLALLLLRLLEPDFGSIRFFGKELLKLNKQEMLSFRKEAQIIFQNPFASLNPRKTILEIIGEPLLFHGLCKSKSEKETQVFSLLNQVGLEEKSAFRYPHAFSGGQRQRIAIARALALNPKFLICDEVISALDLSIQAQILSLLHQLQKNRGLSLLFISHDLSTVERFCDRTIVLYRGRMVEEGNGEELFKNPSHPYTKLLLSSIPKKDPREIKSAAKTPPALREESSCGCPFYPRCPVAIEACSHSLPPEKRKSPSHRFFCIHE